MSVQPVILAAGHSERMGFPKALLPLGNSTFLETILERAIRCVQAVPIVVLGRHAGLIEPGMRCGMLTCFNRDPDRGQFSSLLTALDKVNAECRGCLVWPVDHPFVTDATIEGLLRRFAETDSDITLPVCEGRRGHPGILHRRLFRELRDLGPLGNPKPVMLRHIDSTALIETDDRGTTEDIDTPEDYERWTGRPLASVLRGRGIHLFTHD